jgi:hypothetical protein
VPAALWSDLVREGVPAERMVRADEAAGATAAWAVVAGPGGSQYESPVAVFGSGGGRLAVHPTALAPAEAPAQEAPSAEQGRTD